MSQSNHTVGHVLKVGGIPDDLLRRIDERVSGRRLGGRAQYIRDLIERDLESPGLTTFRDILETVHADDLGMSEDQLDAFFDDVRADVFTANQAKRAAN